MACPESEAVIWQNKELNLKQGFPDHFLGPKISLTPLLKLKVHKNEFINILALNQATDSLVKPRHAEDPKHTAISEKLPQGAIAMKHCSCYLSAPRKTQSASEHRQSFRSFLSLFAVMYKPLRLSYTMERLLTMEAGQALRKGASVHLYSVISASAFFTQRKHHGKRGK